MTTRSYEKIINDFMNKLTAEPGTLEEYIGAIDHVIGDLEMARDAAEDDLEARQRDDDIYPLRRRRRMIEPTSQQIFDKVALHLLKQGCRSESTTERSTTNPQASLCMYRGPNGTMCAVGCLIPDDRYSPNLERETADQLIMYHSMLIQYLGRDTELLLDLQTLHDTQEPEEWRDQLANVGCAHGLDISVLE